MFFKRYFCDVKWFVSRYRTVLLSFFIPVVILEIAYMIHGIYPFGGRSLLIIDLYHQYAPFLLELRDKILSLSSPLYTWTGGLGTGFLSLFAYYVASPLNILIVLFPESYLSEAVLFLVLLKVGLAGTCFAWYLNGTHKQDNPAIAAFSVLYALSGYVLAYSWNIMWLDCIYLLPVVMLGLVRLVRDGRGLLFCISLALVIFTNFYVAFFVCIFVMFYYPACYSQYHQFSNPGVLLRKTASFAAYSLLAAGLTAVLILPSWFSLQITSAAGESIPKNVTHYFDVFDYLSRHFTLASPSIREGMANIYPGIVVLIMLPLYFMNGQIRHKVKLLHAALMLILIASFNTNILNFIWHGFHFPNQLPFRNSFVYVFLVLSMAYPAYMGLKKMDRKITGLVCASVMLIVVLSQKLGVKEVDIPTTYICLAVLAGYAAVLTLKRDSRLGAYALGLLFLFMVTAEAVVNTIMVVNKVAMTEGYSSRNGYSNGNVVDDIRKLIDEIQDREKDFYRIEVSPPRTTNDGFLYGYRGLSIFSSTFPEKPVKLIERLGFHSNGINSYKYEGSTLLLDSLFSIRYLVRRGGNVRHVLREEAAGTDNVKVYKNPHVVSPGFVAPESIKTWNTYGNNPFTVQNEFVDIIVSGSGNILANLDQEKGYAQNLELTSHSSGYYNYTRKNGGSEAAVHIKILPEYDRETYIYVDVKTSSFKDGFVMVGEEKLTFNATRSTMIDLGYVEADTDVELSMTLKDTSPDSGNFKVYACQLDEEAFGDAFSVIENRQLEVKQFGSSWMTGNVKTDCDGVMLMTVPYDPGWNVRVDGVNVESYAIADCFLGYDMPAGEHEIEMRYVPERFYEGLPITLISLFVVIAVAKRRRIIQ